MNKVFLAVLAIALTGGCTSLSLQFYPARGFTASTVPKKSPDAVEVLFDSSPMCSFRDVGNIVYDWTRDGVVTSKERTIDAARRKASEVGADGIYDLKFDEHRVSVAVSTTAINYRQNAVEYGLRAKAYICDSGASSTFAQTGPDASPSPTQPGPVGTGSISPVTAYQSTVADDDKAAVPSGEARTALVIGNARYPTSPLRTPQNDARAFGASLRSVGFDVTLIENGTRRDVIAAIEGFGAKLRRNGGVGMFFYAGHGVQIHGKNYLIPVDAQVRSEVTALSETVDTEWLLATMAEARTRINIVILDACRENPFERKLRGMGRGLAPLSASDATGTLIAYSTDPGKTAADGDGEHSPYAESLIDAIVVPGLSIEQVFKRVRRKVQDVTAGAQTPWETSNLTGDFFFKPK